MIAIRDTLPMHPDQVTRDTVVDFIIELFHHMGSQDYLGEAISQGEHGIQCAIMADQLEGKDTLTAAALLHDLGHFLHTRAEDCADQGIDAQHEDFGADFLAKFYPPAVSEPVRLHVNAKRYLCAVEPEYFDRLSDASIHSLELQGGPLKGAELDAFASNPYRDDAVILRRCDEGAKVPDLALPDIETFRDLLTRVL
ncbi:MAG: HD domain-containing protein [Alphaproteobacteria bacterium]|nr:HD domain-containing protein [Alphaproteobacteria bacterium]